MKRIIAAVIIQMGVLALAQQPAGPPSPPVPAVVKVTPKAPYDSTKAQLWAEKQKNLQLQAVQLQAQYQAGVKDLGDKYNSITQSLDAWVGAVRTANGWDDTYTWDRDSDTWTHTPKPPPPADPAKK